MTLPNDPIASHPQDAPAVQEPAGAASKISTQTDGAPAVASTEASAEVTAPKQPMTQERMAEEMDRLDRVLVGLLVLLSFLLGSFAARNYDFWLQMANGREIVHGGLRAGEDPFTYTTSSGQWVNPCWLYDVLLYKIAGAADYGMVSPARAAILVLLKALAVTALAVLLLQIRRRDQSLWIPVACVAAAMLACSPRFALLGLQSTCISYIFLGITMYLLVNRPAEDQRRGLGSLVRSRFLLVPLFALWANLDYWFLLGPITVGLYLLAETLQQAFAPVRGEDAPRPGELRSLAIVFVLGLAACLVNPYGFRIFTTLPTDLWLSLPGNPLQDDDLFRQVAASPLGGEYFTRTGFGMTIAGFMYLPLLVAGVLSFAVNSDDLRWWRVTLWVAFCLLSAWMSRLIPFFAIVAAPITALNFQDFAARRFGTAPRMERKWKIWSLGGRIASVVIGAVLLALAWPGWLTASVGDFRSPWRVGYTVTADPLKIQAVHRLAELQQQGVINKGFNLTPEIASYNAWFAPTEKAFFDARFSLFSHKVTGDYVNIRRTLRNRGDMRATEKTDAAAEGSDQTNKQWPALFREYGIDHVVLTSDDIQCDTLVYQMVSDSSQWVLLYMDGKNAVFGWMDPQKPAASYNELRARRLEPNQLAFAPKIPESQRAPQSTRPPEPAQTPSLLTSYWAGPAAPPPAVSEAHIDLVYFEIIQQQWPARSAAAQHLANFCKGMTSAGITGIATVPHLLALNWVIPPGYVQGAFDPGPAGAAYMALRAARRAIAENPEEAAAYRYLGESYQRLWHIMETHWARNPQVLNTLRQVQLVSALQNALAIQPDSPQTHLTLGRLFYDTNQWDLALQEMKTGFQQMKDAGPAYGEENFEQTMAKREEELQKFEQRVQQIQNDYELTAKDKPPEYRAELAYRHGLTAQALQDISEIDPAKLNQEIGRSIVKLLLNMGRLRELQPFEAFEQPMDKAMVAAALGNYTVADELLEDWLKHEDLLATQQLLFVVRATSLQTIMSPGSIGQGLNGVVALRRERADWTVVRGILALEAGDTNAAARHFQEALQIGSRPASAAAKADSSAASSPKASSESPRFQFETQPVAVRYLELLQAAGTYPTPNPDKKPEEEKK